MRGCRSEAHPDMGAHASGAQDASVPPPVALVTGAANGMGHAVATRFLDVHVTPLRHRAEPEEISSAVAFLASDDAIYITGAELAVDGGYLAR